MEPAPVQARGSWASEGGPRHSKDNEDEAAMEGEPTRSLAVRGAPGAGRKARVASENSLPRSRWRRWKTCLILSREGCGGAGRLVLNLTQPIVAEMSRTRERDVSSPGT